MIALQNFTNQVRSKCILSVRYEHQILSISLINAELLGPIGKISKYQALGLDLPFLQKKFPPSNHSVDFVLNVCTLNGAFDSLLKTLLALLQRTRHQNTKPLQGVVTIRLLLLRCFFFIPLFLSDIDVSQRGGQIFYLILSLPRTLRFGIPRSRCLLVCTVNSIVLIPTKIVFTVTRNKRI